MLSIISSSDLKCLCSKCRPVFQYIDGVTTPDHVSMEQCGLQVNEAKVLANAS